MTDAPPSKRPLPGPAALIGVMMTAFALDQFTKWLMVAVVMRPPRLIPVLPGFNLTLGFNEGASFGMMSGVMAGKPLLMVALTGLLALMIAVMAIRANHPLERAGFALIVGGALGNIFDRLRQGAVTDFLDLYWRDWHWPTFNVADIAIALGALCVLGAVLPPRRHKESAS